MVGIWKMNDLLYFGLSVGLFKDAVQTAHAIGK
jgi:hypothetical protein